MELRLASSRRRLSRIPSREHAHGLVASLRELGKNLGAIFTARSGILGMILCLSPISAGASSNLFSSASDRWQVTANTVALVTGVIGGLVMAVGSLLGGFLADRFPRKLLYVAAAMNGAVSYMTVIVGHADTQTPRIFAIPFQVTSRSAVSESPSTLTRNIET